MKTLYLLLLPVLFLSSRASQISKSAISKADSTLISLKNRKKAVDDYVYKHQKDIIVLAKVAGKKALVRVKNEDWPDDTEYTYNIIKDQVGHVVMIAQMPYSESGDWYLEYKHYFDDKGRVYAFSKRETLFDDLVKGGMAVEELLKYYDADSKLVKQTFRLTDKDDNTIKRNKNEFNFRNDKFNIYKDINSCLMGYHIKMPN